MYSVECVSKMKFILTIIAHAIYAAVCYQTTDFSSGDREIILEWAAVTWTLWMVGYRGLVAPVMIASVTS